MSWRYLFKEITEYYEKIFNHTAYIRIVRRNGKGNVTHYKLVDIHYLKLEEFAVCIDESKVLQAEWKPI